MKFGMRFLSFAPAGLVLLIMALMAGAGPAAAQQPQPVTTDYIFKIEPERSVVGPAEEFTVEIVVESKAPGSQGWSYGVDHDEKTLELVSVTTAGTDLDPFTKKFDNTVPSCEQPQGFSQSDAICTGGPAGINIAIGFTQAIILSLAGDAELPVKSRFVMVKARYKVRGGLNIGAGLTTELAFSDSLSATPGGPAVETVISVADGVSMTPTGRDNKVQIRIQAQPDLRLFMTLPQDRKLIANQQDVLPVNILLERKSQGDMLAVLAWSYSIKLDKSLLAAAEFAAGAATAALKGGKGPDFKSYNIDDRSADGAVQGVTAGVVIDLAAPFANDLVLPAGGPALHLETLKLKSAVKINQGDPDRPTALEFVKDVIGENEPTDVVFTSQDGLGLTPDFSAKQTVVLGAGGLAVGRFVRGNANDDAHGADIGDGIWIINHLFYGGPITRCLGAADANDDNRVDLSDAVYLFLWQLQPGKHAGEALYPKPPGPYPACGTDPDLTPEQCPVGSTRCDR
ncbi:MAG: hypothetical protein HY717_10310 [Planctomycetes bacterium]|nr:hypothetical protein [Planctomycetota bacterium]